MFKDRSRFKNPAVPNAVGAVPGRPVQRPTVSPMPAPMAASPATPAAIPAQQGVSSFSGAPIPVRAFKKGGAVKSSASKRADGIAQRGKTRGKVV